MGFWDKPTGSGARAICVCPTRCSSSTNCPAPQLPSSLCCPQVSNLRFDLLRQFTGFGSAGPIQQKTLAGSVCEDVEDEVAQAVGDGGISVLLDLSAHVRMVTDEDIRPQVDSQVRQVALPGGRRHYELAAPVA